MTRAFIITILFVALVAWINPNAGRIKDGNRLYNREFYDEAMTTYTEVLIELPDSPQIHFNIGDAAYKKADYTEAIKSFTKSASLSVDAISEGIVYYNMGNCKYREGRLKERTDPAGAISLYRKALDFYKKSLDKNPRDMDAKYNYEFVSRRIKELLDMLRQQEQQGQGQQQQQGQDGETQEQQQQGQGGQAQEQQQAQQGQGGEQQEEQQEQQQGQGGEQLKEQQGQGSEQQEQQENETQAGMGDEAEPDDERSGQGASQAEDQDEPKEGQGSKSRKGLTPKEAKLLLDSLKDEELSRPDNPLVRRILQRVLKDW